jgi:hypothetical protein
MKRLAIISVLTVSYFLNGCNQYDKVEHKKYYVIESYLVANRNLPQVKVSTTLPINGSYTFKKAALNDANVHIQQLNADGVVAKTYPYHLQSDGIYQPDNPEPVLPKHKYKLKISFPNGDSVQSITYVPGDFHVTLLSASTLTYQSSQLIHLNISQSFYPGRQSYYIFTANAVNPSSKRLTPYYTTTVDITGNFISDYYINSSGVKNEENYKHNTNGTLDVKLPWELIAFYVKNRIVINTIDDNLYDFIRSEKVQTGGSILPPGQAQNIKYHVQGGIGIFGSMASDTTTVYIKKNANL